MHLVDDNACSTHGHSHTPLIGNCGCILYMKERDSVQERAILPRSAASFSPSAPCKNSSNAMHDAILLTGISS
jgi:hypothetical protein